MKSVLMQATKATLQAALAQPAGFQRYSQFPVHEQEFWEKLFKLAADPKKAKQVLVEIEKIEEEPCIENERIDRNCQSVRKIARLALMH